MFTYGFYDSMQGDRKYNAEQISSIFDGIIEDGVYSNVGDALMVVAGTGMQVIVKTGRAWFKHTWSLNDTYMPLAIATADQYRGRIDAVVIEVNRNTRTNEIKVIMGTPATTPTKPTLVHDSNVDQYALAYVTVDAEVTEIGADKIEIVVGMNETPFVQCPLKTVSIADLFNQWQGEFDEWFANVQSQLAGDIASNLQNQINQRVKISDKANASDILNHVPNKWVDAAAFNPADLIAATALPGQIIHSPQINLEERFPEKFKACDHRYVTENDMNGPLHKHILSGRIGNIKKMPIVLDADSPPSYGIGGASILTEPLDWPGVGSVLFLTIDYSNKSMSVVFRAYDTNNIRCHSFSGLTITEASGVTNGARIFRSYLAVSTQDYFYLIDSRFSMVTVKIKTASEYIAAGSPTWSGGSLSILNDKLVYQNLSTDVSGSNREVRFQAFWVGSDLQPHWTSYMIKRNLANLPSDIRGGQMGIPGSFFTNYRGEQVISDSEGIYRVAWTGTTSCQIITLTKNMTWTTRTVSLGLGHPNSTLTFVGYKNGWFHICSLVKFGDSQVIIPDGQYVTLYKLCSDSIHLSTGTVSYADSMTTMGTCVAAFLPADTAKETNWFSIEERDGQNYYFFGGGIYPAQDMLNNVFYCPTYYSNHPILIDTNLTKVEVCSKFRVPMVPTAVASGYSFLNYRKYPLYISNFEGDAISYRRTRSVSQYEKEIANECPDQTAYSNLNPDLSSSANSIRKSSYVDVVHMFDMNNMVSISLMSYEFLRLYLSPSTVAYPILADDEGYYIFLNTGLPPDASISSSTRGFFISFKDLRLPLKLDSYIRMPE